MALFLGTMLLGITVLATISGAIPSDRESILSQIGRATFGTAPVYYLLQLSALGILILAAQTSFADFPRLSSFLARDRYFPRQFSYRGERLSGGRVATPRTYDLLGYARPKTPPAETTLFD